MQICSSKGFRLITLLFTTALIVPLELFSQAPVLDIPALVDERETLYEELVARLPEHQRETKESRDGALTFRVTSYYREETLRMVQQFEEGDGITIESRFVYENGMVVFVVREEKRYQLWPGMRTTDLGRTVDRYYYDRESLIHWTRLQETTVDPREEYYDDYERDLGSRARDLIGFAASDYLRLEEYYRSSAEPNDWRELPDHGTISDLPDEPRRFLSSLVKTIEEHDWEAFLGSVARSHYETQVGEFGLSREQYIRELLGLNFVGNQLTPPPSQEAAPFGALNRIVRIELSDWSRLGEELAVFGTVQLDNGDELRVELLLRRSFNGIFLTGGVG